MVGVSRTWKFVESILLREYDVDPGGPAGISSDFSQQPSSFVLSTAVCSAPFRRDLLLEVLNPYHLISVVTALQTTAQLGAQWSVLLAVSLVGA